MNELISKSDPERKYQGITYSVSQGNRFVDANWLLQNPLQQWWGVTADKLPYYPFAEYSDDFGLPICHHDEDCNTQNGSYQCDHLAAFDNGDQDDQLKMCLGHSDGWVDNIYRTIVQAKHVVDITTIEPFPDKRFLATIRNALTYLAYQGRPVTVRILEGLYPFGPPDTQVTTAQAQLDLARAKKNDEAYLQALIRDLKNIPQSNLNIYVASMRTCDGGLLCAGGVGIPYRFSGNHAKIIVVDGKTVISGGENLRTNEYLENAPVHDVSISFTGPAAMTAHQFANRLWQFVCSKNHIPSLGIVADWRSYGPYSQHCAASLSVPTPNYPVGHVSVMALGTLGTGMVPGEPKSGDQSEVARTLFFQQAQKTVRISQQDIGLGLGALGVIWQRDNVAGNDMQALAKLLLNNGDVYIVTSSYGAVRLYLPLENQTNLGDSYSNKVTLEQIGEKFEKTIKSLNKNLTNQQIHDLVCNHLYLAPIRFSYKDNAWSKQYQIANHAKVWIIDDHAFYVGSHNMYPSGLQEFGYVIANQKVTNEFLQNYWDNLWKYSSKVAISGKGVQCRIPMLT